MPRSDRDLTRDREIWDARSEGVSVAVLAERYGVSERRIYQIEARVRARLPAADRDLLRSELTARLNAIRAGLAELARQPAAPVTASSGQGVEYVRDPETGEYVRDHSGRLAANKLELAVIDREAKMLGLDAPAQTVTEASVRYELVGTEADPDGI